MTKGHIWEQPPASTRLDTTLRGSAGHRSELCATTATTRCPPDPELAPEQVEADEPRVGRAAMLGAALGFAIVTVVITVAGTAGGIEPGSALGLGAFVGLWGGAGFGFVLGATLTLARHTDAGHFGSTNQRRTRRAR